MVRWSKAFINLWSVAKLIWRINIHITSKQEKPTYKKDKEISDIDHIMRETETSIDMYQLNSTYWKKISSFF